MDLDARTWGPYLASTLRAPDARFKRFLVPERLERVLAEHDSGARNHGHVIWTLLTLEIFLRPEGW